MDKLTMRQYLSIGFLVLLLLGIPVTLYVTQQQQETRTRAGASTTLYYTPNATSTSPIQLDAGQSTSVDIMIDPGNNLPSVVKLQLQYDPTLFEVAGSSSFTPNTAAFPTTLEGPVVSNGNVYVSLSIGSDGTKAIQQVTKVGTLTLKALQPTTTDPAVLSFGSNSQVLSVAVTDESSENVLATTNPTYIEINATITPTTIPTPTQSVPTATTVPSINPTQGLSPTVAPTAAPSATTAPTSSTPSVTTLALTVFMHGIGNSGDNANPSNSTLSNKTPLNPNRSVAVEIFDVTNQLVASTTGTVVYDDTAGNFAGTVAVPGIAQGAYTVKVQSPQHLRRIVPGIHTIVPLQENVLPEITLIAGDVNTDNLINIIDYNLLIGCYSDLLPPVSCTDDLKAQADLNDDGAVNQIDYNFFLREITVQAGS